MHKHIYSYEFVRFNYASQTISLDLNYLIFISLELFESLEDQQYFDITTQIYYLPIVPIYWFGNVLDEFIESVVSVYHGTSIVDEIETAATVVTAPQVIIKI